MRFLGPAEPSLPALSDFLEDSSRPPRAPHNDFCPGKSFLLAFCWLSVLLLKFCNRHVAHFDVLLCVGEFAVQFGNGMTAGHCFSSSFVLLAPRASVEPEE
jgi:hypothetical protein